MEKELISLGKVTSPVGIKGEVKVFSFVDEEVFKVGLKLVISKKEYHIERVRIQKDMPVIKLFEINDRGSAEALRGLEVKAEKGSFALPENTFLTEDLLGMDVFEKDGRFVGKLAEILSNPARDLYRIEKPNGGSFLLPAADAFIKEIDIPRRRITVELIEGLE